VYTLLRKPRSQSHSVGRIHFPLWLRKRGLPTFWIWIVNRSKVTYACAEWLPLHGSFDWHVQKNPSRGLFGWSHHMRGGARLDVRCKVNWSFDKTGRAKTTVNNKYHDSICGRWPSRVCFLKPRDSRKKVRSWLAAVKLWSCSNLKTSGF